MSQHSGLSDPPEHKVLEGERRQKIAAIIMILDKTMLSV
jgi:hypothetical protein